MVHYRDALPYIAIVADLSLVDTAKNPCTYKWL